MQKCGKILRGTKRYSRPRGFKIVGASAPVVPTPLVGRQSDVLRVE